MIDYKTEEEIEIMRQGGLKLRKVVKELLPQIQIGMSTLQIDGIATELIKKQGAELSFTKVADYKWATCLTINEQVVHTPPSTQKVKDGDVLTVDIGLYHKGYHVDYSTTFIVGKAKDNKTVKFLQVGEKALAKAVQKALVGNYLGDISEIIEKEIYGNGYFIMKQLTGHGIGHELHEDPYVPGYLDRAKHKTHLIKSGLVIAIEVIYSMGTEEIAYEKGNEWSIVSKDLSLTACFEHTVAITEKGYELLT